MMKWKPVNLNEGILAGGIEGLVGIEELTDYAIEDFRSNSGSSLKRKKKDKNINNVSRKHKKIKTCAGESVTIQDNNIKTVTKSSKKKQIDSLEFLEEMKSWDGFMIRNEILRALYDKQFFDPTEIQRMSFDASIHGRRDILGAAETGSGKTLAFGIPIVNGILNLKDRISKENVKEVQETENSDESDWEEDTEGAGCVKVRNLREGKVETKRSELYCLILTPTRELAVQIKNHISDICKYTDIRVSLIIGGLAEQKQERLLKRRPEIIVATPGRLWEFISLGYEHLNSVNSIRYLVIDETDRMLEKGHFDELQKLLEKINFNEEMKKQRQNFVFSATLTVVHDPPQYLRGKKRKRITGGQKLQELMSRIGITNPKVVDLTGQRVIAETIKELKINCQHEEKDYFLYYFLLKYPGRTLIFCNSISCVRRLASILSLLNCRPLPLHANMEQRQRLKNLDKFRDNDNSILLATDVAARGLDIPNVKHVVHYQIPNTAESYVHRSGRTARGKRDGTTLIIVEPKLYRNYVKILQTLGRKDEIEDLPVDSSIMSDIKKRVQSARNVDELTSAVKKQSSSRSWFEKAVKDMDIILDEEELPRKLEDNVSSNIKKDLMLKQKQLKLLLAMPLVPNRFSGKYPGMNVNNPESGVRTTSEERRTGPGAYVLKKPKTV